MHIDYLADYPQHAPVLAAWHHAEWHDLLPGWTCEEALTELRRHTGRRQIPTTFVALDGDDLLGSASLLEADLDGWDHLSPWLASVYVVPHARGRGVGRELVARVVAEAAALGVGVLHLWTAGQQAWYSRLGWSPLHYTRHGEHDVTIMVIRPGAG